MIDMAGFDDAFDSLPRYKVPARRYPQFITAFEKKVTEAQDTIRKIEALQQPYNIAVSVMEEASLENECSVNLYPNSVCISINATQKDNSSLFKQLSTKLGVALKAAGIHKDAVPAYGTNQYQASFTYTWRLSDIKKSVVVTVHLPEGGIEDLAVIKTWHTNTYSQFQICERSKLIIEPKHSGQVADIKLDYLQHWMDQMIEPQASNMKKLMNEMLNKELKELENDRT
jgi:hypothetical protein